jgi:hypothetical protein
MSSRATSPLRAAVGLVAVTADGVRKLPELLVTLPPLVGRQLEAARERYAELARHGQDVLAGPREHRTDPEALANLLDQATPEPEPAAVVEPATPEPVEPTPIGLTEPVTLPEDVLDEVAQLPSGADLAHDELPLPDFDHQTVPQLRGRLRTLALPQLVQLRDYEQAHAARLPVLTLLDNRIAKLTGQ